MNCDAHQYGRPTFLRTQYFDYGIVVHLSMSDFIYKRRLNEVFLSDIHSHNTKGKNNLENPKFRLHLYLRLKLYNKFSLIMRHTLITIVNRIRCFNCYSLQEYLNTDLG